MLQINWFEAFFVGLIYGINGGEMLGKSINRLTYLCDTIPPLLSAMDEQTFTLKPHAEKWSRKEIIGHLIDSAANNHQRFVRGQFEQNPTITYDPDNWNTYNYYSKLDSAQIISFWEIYNRHILELIKNIPQELLNKQVNTGAQNSFSIAFLFNDYVEHLEHHLRQVIDY
jgi:hypothetical protein